MADRFTMVNIFNSDSRLSDKLTSFEAFVVRRTETELVVKTDRIPEKDFEMFEKPMEVDVFEQPNEFVPASMMRAVEAVQSGALDLLLMPKPRLEVYCFAYLYF